MLGSDLLQDSFGVLGQEIALRILVGALFEDHLVLDGDLDAAGHRCLAVLVVVCATLWAKCLALSELEHLLKTRLWVPDQRFLLQLLLHLGVCVASARPIGQQVGALAADYLEDLTDVVQHAVVEDGLDQLNVTEVAWAVNL